MADSNSNSLLGMPSLSSAAQVDYLTPQQAQALANIAYAPQEQDSIKQQLQQADALRNGQLPTRHSPLAAAFDGVGDIAKKVQAFQQENRLRGQQQDLLSQQKTAYGDFLKQLAQAQQLRNGGQQQPQQQPQGNPLEPAPDASGTWQA